MPFHRQSLRRRVFHRSCAKESNAEHAVYGSFMQYFEDVLYLCGDIGFTIGSVFLFPSLDMDFGLASSWLFIGFSAMNMVLGSHDLFETLQAKKLGLTSLERSEVLECLMNLLSALLFTVGCFLGLPNFDTDDFWWDDLFSVFGSFALVVSSFYNALGMAADKSETLLSRICLCCSLTGAVMFTTGSCLYLPKIVDVDVAYNLGTWLYVLGSALFTTSGIISTVMIYQASQQQDKKADATL
ncbi:unnamed protein product [Polarella glacialis]|uniref:YrhK domain-containing protein n=1 Tax=Polarella glacialis TaxID=89957 RepID=A0A813J9Z3_POLGL|nr:unnamed protein product [Polarella glacialis]CAE8677083.1 unnamed protein product [Polarella glacialis]